MLDIISPADAFRLLLSARYRRTTLQFADKINSYAWFGYPKSLGIPLCVHAAALAAIKKLCRHVKGGDIRLRGELCKEVPPVDIDQADCLVGELDVFNQTLTIHGQGLTIDRIYRRVFCSAPDVARIAEGISTEPVAPVAPVELVTPVEPVAPVKPVAPVERSPFAVVATLNRNVPSHIIRSAITAVYDDADKGVGPRPNINELPSAVQPRLAALGYQASGRQIKQIGKEKEFSSRRNEVGSGRPPSPGLTVSE
jgi:hypothetical protein